MPVDPAVDVVLDVADPGEAAAGAAELYRSRLAPWLRSLASGRPDVTAPPHLTPYDPGWAAVASRRSQALHRALGGLDPADGLSLQRIDHIGSTAVPVWRPNPSWISK